MCVASHMMHADKHIKEREKHIIAYEKFWATQKEKTMAIRTQATLTLIVQSIKPAAMLLSHTPPYDSI